MAKDTPVVLVSGGVGVTPMLSMAHAINAAGAKREIYFFFGARNYNEHIHKDEMLRLAAEYENVHLHVCYSKPDATRDKKGVDYQHEGRVTVDLFKEVLPSNNFDYFLCGNGAFMKSISDGLEAWGVPEKNVNFEAFGPATVKKKTAPPAAAVVGAPAAGIEVTFSKTGKSCQWSPNGGSLLDFALEQGVRIDFGLPRRKLAAVAWWPSNPETLNISVKPGKTRNGFVSDVYLQAKGTAGSRRLSSFHLGFNIWLHPH